MLDFILRLVRRALLLTVLVVELLTRLGQVRLALLQPLLFPQMLAVHDDIEVFVASVR